MPRSNASTIRTVDDVLSRVDEETDARASVGEVREFVRRLKLDANLTRLAIAEIDSISSLIAVITPNVSKMMDLMLRCNAVIGGVQATSFFYPMCDLEDAPFDIFCHSSSHETFVDGYMGSSNATLIEAVQPRDGPKVFHFRFHPNGAKSPCNVRIFVSDRDPIECVLSLRASYEQSIITPTTGVCFWPKLQSLKRYRMFTANEGLRSYPRGDTKYTIKLDLPTRTYPRKAQVAPTIEHGLQKRTESISFQNECNLDKVLFAKDSSKIRNMVFSIYNESTRYLGSTGGMT